MAQAETITVPDGEVPPGLEPQFDMDAVNAAADIAGEQELDAETLSGLGGGMVMGGQVFAPPSVACLALLEIIDSPFLTMDFSDVELLDVLRTLYVLQFRSDAVAPIAALRKAQAQVEAFAARLQDGGAVVSAYVDRLERAWTAFDKLVLDWGETLGSLDLELAMDELKGYMLACMGGYDMVPGSDEPQVKKKEPMI